MRCCQIPFATQHFRFSFTFQAVPAWLALRSKLAWPPSAHFGPVAFARGNETSLSRPGLAHKINDSEKGVLSGHNVHELGNPL